MNQNGILLQAYRDWGVELFDWQSQSSMLADEGGLTATDRRMMPTVGARRVVASPPSACKLLLLLQPFDQRSGACATAVLNTHPPRCLHLPVGCEADAIAYTQDARQLFSTAAAGLPPTVSPNGSYSTGPCDVSAADCHKAAFEACLMLPCQPGAQQHRLRVVHNLARLGAEACWQLQDVELHSER